MYRIPTPELLPEPVRDVARTVAAIVARYEQAHADRAAAERALIDAERSRPDVVRRAAAAGDPIPADPVPALRAAADEAGVVERSIKMQVDAERNRLRAALAELPPESVESADETVEAATSAYADALAAVKQRRADLHESLRLRGWLGQAIIPRQVGGSWETSLGTWSEHAPPPSLDRPVQWRDPNGQTRETTLTAALAALAADADRLDTLRADEARRLDRARRDAAAVAYNARTVVAQAGADVAERVAVKRERKAAPAA